MRRTVTIAHTVGGAVHNDTVTGFARLSCGDVLIAEHAHWNAGPPMALNYAYLLRSDGTWVKVHLPTKLTEFIAHAEPGTRAKVSNRNVEMLYPRDVPSMIAVVRAGPTAARPVRTAIPAPVSDGGDLPAW